MTGFQLYEKMDGTMGACVWRDGRPVDVDPHPDVLSLPFGWYDFDMNPIPDPLGREPCDVGGTDG